MLSNDFLQMNTKIRTYSVNISHVAYYVTKVFTKRHTFLGGDDVIIRIEVVTENVLYNFGNSREIVWTPL